MLLKCHMKRSCLSVAVAGVLPSLNLVSYLDQSVHTSLALEAYCSVSSPCVVSSVVILVEYAAGWGNKKKTKKNNCIGINFMMSNDIYSLFTK